MVFHAHVHNTATNQHTRRRERVQGLCACTYMNACTFVLSGICNPMSILCMEFYFKCANMKTFILYLIIKETSIIQPEIMLLINLIIQWTLFFSATAHLCLVCDGDCS